MGPAVAMTITLASSFESHPLNANIIMNKTEKNPDRFATISTSPR